MSSAVSPAICFLDTSALVKHYHEEEGSEVVERLFQEPERRLMISDLSIIEFYSAIALKVRTKEIKAKTFTNLRKLFAHDLKEGLYEVVLFREQEKRLATKLLIKHAPRRSLRTLDAIQLAVMKSKGGEAISAVVCADERFCRIIASEGFNIINPIAEAPTPKSNKERR